MADDLAAVRKDVNALYVHLGLPVPGTEPPGAALRWDGPLVLTPQGTATGSWTTDPARTVLLQTVSRDGVDTTGHPPWSGVIAPNLRTVQFDKLKPKTTYTLRVQVKYADGAVEEISSVATMPAAPVDPDPVDPPTGERSWLSGVSDGPGVILRTWPEFTRQPTKYARTWADQGAGNMANLPAMDEVTRGGFTGVLDIAWGGPSNWFDAADGGYDDEWIKQCRRALEIWRGLRCLHISTAHEFNNRPGYPWAISADENAAFRTACGRLYAIVQAELVAKGKNAKVVLSTNADTNGGWSLAQGMPDPKHFDIWGVDYYSFYPPVANEAAWNDMFMKMKGDTPRGLGAHRRHAKNLGKPFSLPEWGLNPGEPGNRVDNPFFIRKMNGFCRESAPLDPYNPGPGELAGEAYFNAWEPNGQLAPTSPSAPQSRAEYLRLKWGV